MTLSTLRKYVEQFRARRSTRPENERGGAMVELAMLAVPLLTIALGTVEVGVLWQDSLVLNEASRSGARVAAALVNEPSADREALRAVVSHIDANDLDEVEYVVIYQLDASGQMPSGCDSASQTTCNHYPKTALLDLDDDTRWECGGGSYDASWCPTGRDAQFHSPIDVGVLIMTDQGSLTGFFPGGTQVSGETIMRLNPLIR